MEAEQHAVPWTRREETIKAALQHREVLIDLRNRDIRP